MIVKRSGIFFKEKTLADFPDPPFPQDPLNEPEMVNEATNFVDLIETMSDIYSEVEDGKRDPDFQVHVTFGDYTSDSSLEGFSMHDLREEGSDTFPGAADESPDEWVLDVGIVSYEIFSDHIDITLSTERTYARG